MALEFVGEGRLLSNEDIEKIADELSVEVAVIRAVDEVESNGKGFLDDKRPIILFERHIFSRRTKHRWDTEYPDISNPTRGGYGKSGGNQYEKLYRAIKLDRQAALRSASWGRYQVMGFNAELCGWRDVENFVEDMTKSEAEHLKAFVNFCRANDLVRYLVVHDWRSFTKGYNGPGNVEEYSTKIEKAYEKYKSQGDSNIVMPREVIKRVQEALRVTNDGIFGPRSREALNRVLRATGQDEI